MSCEVINCDDISNGFKWKWEKNADNDFYILLLSLSQRLYIYIYNIIKSRDWRCRVGLLRRRAEGRGQVGCRSTRKFSRINELKYYEINYHPPRSRGKSLTYIIFRWRKKEGKKGAEGYYYYPTLVIPKHWKDRALSVLSTHRHNK